MANEQLSDIRLCVAGTPSAGKTFLIHSILKSINSDRLGEDLDFELREITLGSVLPPGQLLSDIKTNISRGGVGTAHSANPKLYEYEYHFKLSKEKIKKQWIRNLFIKIVGRTPKNEVNFRIKNIPGEMFSLYFKHRPGYLTINNLFENYISNNIEIHQLLDTYKTEIVTRLTSFETLKNDFHKYCDEEVFKGADNKVRGDLDEVTKNFYSYLFFYTSTDVLICHDVNLSEKDGSMSDSAAKVEHDVDLSERVTPMLKKLEEMKYTETIKQDEFLSTIHYQYNEYIRNGKRLYYAFTKFDKCMKQPEVNYVSEEIKNIDDYWLISKQLLQNIYNKENFVDSKVGRSIEGLKKFTNAFPLISCNSLPNKELIKYVFFVCTNYSNFEDRRGFLNFPTSQTTSNTNYWNEHNYLTEVQPLGVLEFIISLVHRSGYYDSSDMNMHLDSNDHDIILQTYI